MVGKTLAKAKSSLRSHHCRVGTITRKYSSQSKKGKVLSQSPKAGKRYAVGHKVNLKVGKGPHH